jgi:SAM-dependent methyltransferase
VERTLEPELMDEADQAAAYAAADFAEPNQGFVDRFLALAPELTAGELVDLGCGPADICLRLARARPGLRITGVDAAEAMLAHGRAALAAAGLTGTVELVRARLPGVLPGRQFDAVLSNSLLHHLPDPAVLWADVARLTRPGAPILVVDLMRPPTPAAALALVDQHAAGEPEVLRRDFLASLHAAFTLAEVTAQLAAAGLALQVAPITDRHLAVWGRAV